MDRSLTALAFFIAVALAAALLWPVFTDWDEERANLEASMEEILGGPVTLEGDVSVRILPTPRLTAARVALADGEGRLSVAGANLRAEIALWPLFLGEVVVNRFVLSGGDIHLNGNAASLRALGDDMARRMSLGSGRFRYVVAPQNLFLGSSENAIIFTQPHLELWSEGSGTLIRFAMRALEDEALRADVTFRPQAAGPWRVDWHATYLEDALEFRGAGELDRFYAGASFVGDFALLADDINRVVGWEGEGPALSARGPFRAAGAQWFMDPTEITLGTTQITVEAQGQTADGLSISGRANSALADLDALGLEIAVLRDLFAKSDADGSDQMVPFWLSATIDVTADGLMLNRRVVRDLVTDVRLENGKLQLNRFAALLPGGTEARYFPRPDGTRGLNVTSSSLRSLLGWLDYDVGNINGEYLQELVLDAEIEEGPQTLQVIVNTLALDGGTARGQFSRDENGATTIEAEIADLDLDAYSPASLSGSFIDRMQALADLVGTNEGAGIDLEGTNVTLAGANLRSFEATALTNNQILTIERAQMVFASGGSLSAQGQWSNNGDPVALIISGRDVDPSLFAGLPLAPSAPADLDLNLENSISGLALEGTIRSAGLEIILDGSSDGNAETQAINGHLIARALEPGALASTLGLEEFSSEIGSEVGAELLDIRWSGPLEDGEIIAELTLAGLLLRAEGLAANILSPTLRAEVSLNVQGQELSRALLQLGGPLETDLAGMRFATAGHLSGEGSNWRYQSTSARIGDTPVAMDVSTSGHQTYSGSVRLARVVVVNEAAPDDTASSDASSTLAWSTEQFDLAWMEGPTANLNIAIDALDFGTVQFEDVSFRMMFEAGTIVIEEARGLMEGGILTGSGTIARDGPALSVIVDMAGEGLPAAMVLAPAGLPQTSGRLTLANHMEGRGRSPFDLVASLDGRLDFSMNDGGFDTINMGYLGISMGVVRTRIALREAANQTMQQGTTPIVRLEGLVPLSRGVFNLDGMEGIAETGPFSLAGSIDMRSQIVDVESTFLLSDKEASNLPVTVAFRGIGGSLSSTIDIVEMQAGIEDRLADANLDLLSSEDLPEDLQELLQAYEEAYSSDTSTP